MTWKALARQESRLLIGTRSIRALLGVLISVILLSAYIYPLAGSDPITTARFPGFVSGWLTTLLPVVGIILGYDAVVSDRESGALLLSLALPQGRNDVVLGQVASRVGLLTGAILLGMAGAGFLVVYPFGALDLLPFLAFTVLTVGLGFIWVSLGIAVSLAVATKQRAIILGFGLLFVLAFLWDVLPTALEFGLNTAGLTDGTLPGPVQFLFGLDPGTVFQRVTDGFIDPSSSVDGPWYLNEWVALVVFVCWTVGPLGLAYRRFARSDLV